MGVIPFLRHDLRIISGGTRDLASLPWLELYIVDEAPDEHAREARAVSVYKRRVFRGDDSVSHLHVLRGEDIAVFAVLIAYEGDEGGAVGIVLDSRDLSLDAKLHLLEIHNAVALLVPAALMAHGDTALVVPSRVGLQVLQKLALRFVARKQLAVFHRRIMPPRRRC